jgi:hypothetical protein
LRLKMSELSWNRWPVGSSGSFVPEMASHTCHDTCAPVGES